MYVGVKVQMFPSLSTNLPVTSTILKNYWRTLARSWRMCFSHCLRWPLIQAHTLTCTSSSTRSDMTLCTLVYTAILKRSFKTRTALGKETLFKYTLMKADNYRPSSIWWKIWTFNFFDSLILGPSLFFLFNSLWPKVEGDRCVWWD